MKSAGQTKILAPVCAPGRGKRASTTLSILVNRDWFFLSHFLDRALFAKRAGYHVAVICQDTGHANQITAAGLEHIALDMRRHSASPWGLLRSYNEVKKIYRDLHHTVVWHIGLMSIVSGTPAAQFSGIRGIVNAPVGMGWVFSSGGIKAMLLRPFLRLALRALLNPRGSKAVFENIDDLNEMVALRAVHAKDAVLIRGAGVDLVRYTASAEPDSVAVVLFAARLIWEKGVREFVEAARLLSAKGIEARFQIAGGIDWDSSSAVPEEQMRAWADEGIVEWLGPRQDMPQVITTCHIFCLPSWYREGLPKVILEAMACGRAVVTTDMPGCREAVGHDDNGLLVPPRDVRALADALQTLLCDSRQRQRYGQRGRERAETEFSSEQVCRQTLAVFDQIAGVRDHCPARSAQRPR
ncbi:MAG: glycosyltransferase family 4 protein [Candidatus Igneacidithiobacillus chanchocoensis]